MGFRSQYLTSEALDFKPFSALLCRRGLCLWHRMDSWRGAKHLHKAHNETIPKCRFAEKPCAASIFAKRKRLIVSDTLVSKLSTLFLVRERRLELPRRLTHAPQTCLSTYSSTLAYLADALTPFKVVRITRRATSKAWRIIADYLDLSRVNFDFLKFFLFGAV